MAFTDPAIDNLVEKSTGGDNGAPEFAVFRKCELRAGAAPGAAVAGRFISMWRRDGFPGAGAAPGGSVRNPTRTTAGALRPYTNPAGGRSKMLRYCEVGASIRGGMILYDRLLDISGLSGTSTSAQTVGGTLTRYTGGEGNQIAVEIYTAIGGTGTTITASYTNQAGTSGRTSIALPIGATNANEEDRFFILPLQQGDTGVQAVASVTLAATTGTAGDFGVNIVHPIIELTGMEATGGTWWAAHDGLIECMTDACLFPVWASSGTTAPEFTAIFSWIDV